MATSVLKVSDGSNLYDVLSHQVQGQAARALATAGYVWTGSLWVPAKANASGQAEVQLSGRSTSVEINAVASTTDSTASFDVDYISHIVNDGSVDLYVAFDADSTVSANRITLKPGEVLAGFPRRCTVLHYSCASGSCAFRAVGVK